MQKNRKTGFKIMTIVCIILMFALLVGQYVPFWTYGKDNTTISISDYVWNTREHKGFTSEIKEYIGKYIDLSEIWPPFAYFLLGITAIVMVLVNSSGLLGMCLPLACGLIGIWQYLGISIYRLGQHWGIHLVVFILLTIISALRFVFKPADEEEDIVIPEA